MDNTTVIEVITSSDNANGIIVTPESIVYGLVGLIFWTIINAVVKVKTNSTPENKIESVRDFINAVVTEINATILSIGKVYGKIDPGVEVPSSGSIYQKQLMAALEAMRDELKADYMLMAEKVDLFSQRLKTVETSLGIMSDTYTEMDTS